MEPHITVLTLGVRDLERSLGFYRDGLGLPTEGIVGTEFEDGAVVFFELAGGLKLALYPRDALAKDARAPIGPPGPASFSIGHNVGSNREVDVLMRDAERAGATIAVPPRDTFWGGYAGYFRDPDGNSLELIMRGSWGF
ncbi:MAG: VOC family protein [Gemmatimonadetes bacterium]|nr:VOC family protein [Gemmatimonadota bacterium]